MTAEFVDTFLFPSAMSMHGHGGDSLHRQLLQQLGPSSSSIPTLFPSSQASHSHSRSWSSSSSSRSHMSSPSMDSGSLGGADDISSLSSPTTAGLHNFPPGGFDGFGLFMDPIGTPASSEELLARVGTLSQQVESMREDFACVGTTLKTIQDAVAAPFDPNAPLWLRDGYGAGIRQARIYSGSVELTNLKRKFPNVKFWTRKNYLEHPSSKRNDSASAEKTSTSAGATKRENDINVQGSLRRIRRWNGCMAPRSIKQLGHQARTALVYMLELKFPYLSLCADHWKALRVVSEMYRGWAKNKSGLVGYASDSDSGSDGAGKTGSKRKKVSQTSKPRKQRRVANPAEDPALTRMSPLPQPLPPAESQPSPPCGAPAVASCGAPAVASCGAPAVTASSEGPSGPAPPNNEAEDIFASVVVPPPPPPPGLLAPPPPPLPKPTTKTKKALGPAKAHATHTQPLGFNLCLAVYAVDVGGTAVEFALHWKALTDEKPPSALLKAYDTYSKELKGKRRPAVGAIQKRIQEILGTTSE
ncbi:hypothetical protein MVEN_01574100 [Mycena venus]|uniref:Uncharacterized protein n=1 Tax=Mycena venus TaxID=2733690 RepID=A0A8H6XRS2_9AGAR|nr:hypothetical protein MVEN_01574100 [Mycena venus]